MILWPELFIAVVVLSSNCGTDVDGEGLEMEADFILYYRGATLGRTDPKLHYRGRLDGKVLSWKIDQTEREYERPSVL